MLAQTQMKLLFAESAFVFLLDSDGSDVTV